MDNCFAYRFSDWSGPNVQSPTAYYKCCSSVCRMKLCLHPDGSISYSPSNIGKNHSYECIVDHYMHLIDTYTRNQAIEESFVTSCVSPESVQRADMFSKVRHKDVGFYWCLGKLAQESHNLTHLRTFLAHQKDLNAGRVERAVMNGCARMSLH